MATVAPFVGGLGKPLLSSVQAWKKHHESVHWFQLTSGSHTLFVCVLFSDAYFSNAEYIASNKRVISEKWNGKDLEGNGHDLKLRYYTGIHLDGLRKTTKKSSPTCYFHKCSNCRFICFVKAGSPFIMTLKSCLTTRRAGACVEKTYSSYSFSTSALHEGEWPASRPSGALAQGKGTLVPTGQEAGWAPESICTQRLEKKSFASAGDRTLIALSSSP
jgi:hypothetical protein